MSEQKKPMPTAEEVLQIFSDFIQKHYYIAIELEAGFMVSEEHLSNAAEYIDQFTN